MSLRWWAFSTFIIAATAASGLIFVLNQVYPDTMARFLLFILIFVTFGAGAVPISVYLNHRFASKTWQRHDPNRLARHGLEVGVLAVVLTYLQMIRALDLTIAAVLAGVFILMETFYLTRS